MVDIIEISAMITAAGVLVGVVYYILDIRHSRKAREMEISRVAFSDYISEQALKRWATMLSMQWKDNKDFMEKYNYQSNPEMFGIWTSWFLAWEMMGILVKGKVVRAEEMQDLGGFSAIFAWDKFKDIIQGLRGFSWGQDSLSNAEFFAQEMLKIKMKNDAGFRDKLEAWRSTQVSESE